MFESIVKIRGYNVPYVIQTDVTTFNLSVCDSSLLKTGAQIRWLQTSSLFTGNGYIPRDIVTLSNVYIVLYTDQENSVVLSNGFDHFSLRNSNISSEITCFSRGEFYSFKTNDITVYFGALCTTNECDMLSRQIIVSRAATTSPLNISESISASLISSTTSAIITSIESTSSQAKTPCATKMSPLTTSINSSAYTQMSTETNFISSSTSIQLPIVITSISTYIQLPTVATSTNTFISSTSIQLLTVMASITPSDSIQMSASTRPTSSVSIQETPAPISDIFLVNAKKELENITLDTLHRVSCLITAIFVATVIIQAMHSGFQKCNSFCY